MPHNKMQEYVNIDYSDEMSIVALINEPGQEIIIAEARYARNERDNFFGELGFFVDEKYQGIGLAQYLYKMLIRLARERGLKGFTAEVLQENKGMIKVFEKGGLPVEALLKEGVYKLRIPFD
jgi:GNAT superfamily N-acetyltransferase